MIKDYQEYLYLIEEGLITTHRISKHRNIVDNFLIDYKHKLDINDNDTFSIELYEKDIEFYKSLISLINTLGYFPSYIIVFRKKSKNSFKYDFSIIEKEIKNINFYKLFIMFEAKFDIEIENIGDIIYHIYPIKYKDKILKNGIIPKSRMRKLYHPERCYFTYSKVESEKLVKEFEFIDKINNIENDYGIVSVDTNKLIKNTKFYNDPNSVGFYTYDNIPSYSIIEFVD